MLQKGKTVGDNRVSNRLLLKIGRKQRLDHTAAE